MPGQGKSIFYFITLKLMFCACLGGWVLAFHTAGKSLEIKRRPIEGSTPKVWKGVIAERGSPTICDGDEKTFAVLTPERRDTELGVGLEWPRPEKVDGLWVAYATLNGTAYEPLPEFQSLQYWDGSQWHRLRYAVRIDYRLEGKFAPHQKSGFVSWDYRFDPVEARGIRLLLSKTPSSVRWDQHYVIREMKPYFVGAKHSQHAQFVVVGKAYRKEQTGKWPNLATLEYGAVHSRDDQGEVLSWTREKMVDELVLPGEELSGPIQWWDGRRWRDIPITQLEALNSGSFIVNFLPLAIKKLRLVGLPVSGPLQVRLGPHGREYFERVYHSGKDLLMERVLQSPAEPDFSGVASLLLPVDMHTSIIGRPGDAVECMVHWNGTIVEIENGDRGTWNSGAGRVPGKEEWVDRWFAFAANGEVFGEDINSIRRTYVDGYLPAVVTRYFANGIQFEIEVFTTAPGDPIYSHVVSARVTNLGHREKKTQFAVIMGRRKSAIAGHRRRTQGDTANPMNFEPLTTGYHPDSDGKAVRNEAGEIILYTAINGQWGGTVAENTLSYSLRLPPRQTRELHFVLPSVNAPGPNHAKLEEFNIEKSRSNFKKYWRRTLDEKTRLDLPEQPLNNLYKSLLAQCLIILSDDDKLKYGAYWYESYYGIEEGWPIVALAQFGYRDLAQRSIEIMLSPELMDKSNYHHQYRSGLAPMYAAQVYGLTGDRQWLEKIKPRLIETADWIMEVRRRSNGKSPEFYGLLPKHAYGGDIHAPAYSLYSNATCWRGLQEIGLLMGELGENTLAEKYLANAQEYRESINRLVERTTNRKVSPPFVPLAMEIGKPDSGDYKKVETPYAFIPSDPLGNYWILFAPLLVETGIFPPDSEPNRWITGNMEQHGGLLAGLARFYRGIDHVYGFGYPLQLYGRGERKKFLTTVYSVLAHGHSRDNYTAPEVGGVFPLRTDNIALQERFRESAWKWDLYARGWMEGDFGYSIGSEPLSAGAGVALQLIRRVLLSEHFDAEGRHTGTLDLLKMAPARWLTEGKHVVIERMPTVFGEISVKIQSRLGQGKISGHLVVTPGSYQGKVVLWLRHPKGQPIKEVNLNGKRWADHTSTSVTLPMTGSLEFEVSY